MLTKTSFLHTCPLLFCVIFIAHINAQSCVTPKKEQGECISLRDCDSLMSLINGPAISTESRNLLRASQCGFANNFPKVCCPPQQVASRLSTENFRPEDLPSDCGEGGISRLLGGIVAQIDEHPWLALLVYQKNRSMSLDCGGVLITEKYVLTAAHCIEDQPGRRLVGVRLGEFDLEKELDCDTDIVGRDCADPALDIDVENVKMHEEYNSKNRNNDIGLIRLKKSVRFTDFIRPICLPINDINQNNSLPRHGFIISGWSGTSNRTSFKTRTDIPQVDNENCSESYNRVPITIDSTKFCGGGPEAPGSCLGDYGGPAMKNVRDKNKDLRTYVFGICSFGVCNSRPFVYTNVKEYIPWILSKLAP